MWWGALIGAVVGAVVEVVGQRLSGKPIDWTKVGQAALVGAVTGLVGGAIAGRILHSGAQAAQATTGQVARASVARRVVAGTAGGSGGGAAGRVSDNALSGRPLQDGVVEHAAAGAVIGAAAVPVEAGLRRGTAAVVERVRAARGAPPAGRLGGEVPVARAPPAIVLQPGTTRLLKPETLRFSQRTAGATEAEWTNGLSRADALRQSMRQSGWQDDPVDAVLMGEGPVLVDNTRVAVAREVGLNRIPVRLHAADDPLPPAMLAGPRPRFGPDARTWGDAVRYRTGRQSPPLPPEGTLDAPRLPVEGAPPVRAGGGTREPPPRSEGFTRALSLE